MWGRYSVICCVGERRARAHLGVDMSVFGDDLLAQGGHQAGINPSLERVFQGVSSPQVVPPHAHAHDAADTHVEVPIQDRFLDDVGAGGKTH